MSIHPSLRSQSSSDALRSVLKRHERVRTLMDKGDWKDGRSMFGLPKLKQVKVKVQKAVPLTVRVLERSAFEPPVAGVTVGLYRDHPDAPFRLDVDGWELRASHLLVAECRADASGLATFRGRPGRHPYRVTGSGILQYWGDLVHRREVRSLSSSER